MKKLFTTALIIASTCASFAQTSTTKWITIPMSDISLSTWGDTYGSISTFVSRSSTEIVHDICLVIPSLGGSDGIYAGITYIPDTKYGCIANTVRLTSFDNSRNWEYNFTDTQDGNGRNLAAGGYTQWGCNTITMYEISCQTKNILTGIHNYEEVESKLKLYPNPATTHVVVDCGKSKEAEKSSIRVLNSSGIEVFGSEINENPFKIDIKSWAKNGIYMVQILNSSGNIVESRKLVVE